MKVGYRVVAPICCAFFLGAVQVAYAQSNRPITWTQGVSTECGPGITISVAEMMAKERLGMYPITKDFLKDERDNVLISPDKEGWPDRTGLPQNPMSPVTSQWPPRSLSAVIQSSRTSPVYAVGNSFNGGTSADGGAIPPDTMGGVSSTQVLVVSNNWIRVFSKTGVVGGLNMNVDNFFASVHGGTGISDPKCTFDPISGRWFVVGINLTTPNRVLIAVSSGATITNSASFTFFQFQQDLVGTTPNSNTGGFIDYPTLGVDANAVYVGGSMFNSTLTAYVGNTLFVIRKSALLANSLVVTPARSIGTGSTGVYVGHGCDNWNAAETTGYYLGADAGVFSLLVLHKILTPGGTPSFSSPISITVPTTVFPQVQNAMGSTRPLDALDDRLFAARIHFDKNANRTSIWAAHNIEVTAGGVGSTTGNRNGSRWYEISNLTLAVPTLRQSGTVFDGSATNMRGYWIPSVGTSMQGHSILGSSAAGALLQASVGFATRFAGDALGSMVAPALALTSATNYNVQTSGTQRWGDYSNTVVDPADGMTMWTFQEYCNANNSWAIRAIQMTAPAPAAFSSIIPNNASQGTSLNVVINGTTSGGTGFFDPGPGFTGRLAASFSGTGITVNTVTYANNPAQFTLNITLAPGATTGLRNLTITNPDGQLITANNVFTVNASSAVVNPSSFVINAGSFFGGSLSSLFTSDNQHLTIFNDEIDSIAEVVVTGTSPFGTTSALTFTIETGASRTDLSEFTSLFNYVTNAYEQVNARTSTLADSLINIVIPSNQSRFVQAGTREMRGRLRWIPNSDIDAGDGWTEKIDRSVWTVAP
jgi:hypothetical protein